jgi:hypothetical protein
VIYNFLLSLRRIYRQTLFSFQAADLDRASRTLVKQINEIFVDSIDLDTPVIYAQEPPPGWNSSLALPTVLRKRPGRALCARPDFDPSAHRSPGHGANERTNPLNQVLVAGGCDFSDYSTSDNRTVSVATYLSYMFGGRDSEPHRDRQVREASYTRDEYLGSVR